LSSQTNLGWKKLEINWYWFGDSHECRSVEPGFMFPR
jgi:hypothetical protein